MKFGICTSPEQAPAAKQAGWDYIEASVQALLQGTLPDDQWTGDRAVEAFALPVRAGFLLVPAALKITGPNVDPAALRNYIETITRRAKKVGMEMLVFGSGGARQVPEGFDRARAEQQITDFARTAAEAAGKAGVTIVTEPLNRGECNIVNSVAEAMQHVRAVNHPNFQCLLDTYHFWLEDEPLENVRAAAKWIKHVHVADKEGRVPPGESQASDYRPVFEILKQAGYDGMISVEARTFEPTSYFTALEFLKDQWQQA